LWKQPDARTSAVQLHYTHHWTRDDACWEARPVLHFVLEETERAFVKVEQYTCTAALIDVACCVVVLFAVAVETVFAGDDAPAIATISPAPSSIASSSSASGSASSSRTALPSALTATL
jgi:hypothetical protein